MCWRCLSIHIPSQQQCRRSLQQQQQKEKTRHTRKNSTSAISTGRRRNREKLSRERERERSWTTKDVCYWAAFGIVSVPGRASPYWPMPRGCLHLVATPIFPRRAHLPHSLLLLPPPPCCVFLLLLLLLTPFPPSFSRGGYTYIGMFRRGRKARVCRAAAAACKAAAAATGIFFSFFFLNVLVSLA